MLLWIKFWMILLVLHEGFGIDEPYKEVNGTTCQEIIKLPNYQTRLPCTGKDVRYHCLLNGNFTVEYEVCREWKWIPKGKCAYFNTYGSGNVDERDCNSTSDLSCAVKEYNSADNTQYAVCYMKKEVTTIVPMQETSTRLDATVDGGNATSSNSTGSNDQKGQHGGDIAAAIVFGIIVPPLTVTLLIFLIYLYKEKRKKNRSNTTQGNIPETENLLSIENENNTGNQQNSCTRRDIPVTDMHLSIENENNAQNQRKEKEDETSRKTPEIVDSQSSSSIPNSEETLTQMIPENQGNECSDTESTPVKGSSEIPAQVDDDMQGKKEVAIDIGESELSSPTQGNVEKAENESTENDENRSNKAGNKDEDVNLHAMDNREDSLIPEQVISTTSNQTPKTEINQEDSRNLQDDNTMSDCFTGGSDEERGVSSELKSDEKASKNVTTAENNGGSVNSIQNNHENKNMVDPSNNLTDGSVDQDGNLDACKPNPYSFVETDDKDEPSSSEEEEGTGGVFDDTLDSIKRKDDEEKGGSQDLHEFLKDVSRRLARKMLYHVLKLYVTDPMSYLKDESKKTLVKELLPAEYQASVNIDSDDKKSISVIYAILQLSLTEKPKSGWGQEVKDRDTGIGDDVERLYRVHTLYREISNPEQVSLDGYTRLFKVLFKAVERLDVKGHCKEDYQEFVKKWENLQRDQWYKDNLKALQSFMKKWSLRSSTTD